MRSESVNYNNTIHTQHFSSMSLIIWLKLSMDLAKPRRSLNSVCISSLHSIRTSTSAKPLTFVCPSCHEVKEIVKLKDVNRHYSLAVFCMDCDWLIIKLLEIQTFYSSLNIDVCIQLL